MPRITANAKCKNRSLAFALALCGYDFLHNVVARIFFSWFSFHRKREFYLHEESQYQDFSMIQ